MACDVQRAGARWAERKPEAEYQCTNGMRNWKLDMHVLRSHYFLGSLGVTLVCAEGLTELNSMRRRRFVYKK